MATQRITAEDVLRCDSPWHDHEIWDGVPVLCEPAGGHAGATGADLLVELGMHVRAKRLGRVFSAEQGYVLARDPDVLLAPDVSYVATERLGELPTRGFLELAPDFVIEVRSPTDAWEAVIAKCARWQAHGVPCTWAVDPLQRRTAVFRREGPPVLLTAEDSADGAPVLPDFTVDLQALFDGFQAP